MIAPRRPPIVFHCPDAAEPSGGVRLMFRHHRILAANGWESAVFARTRRGLLRWLEDDSVLSPEEPPGEPIRVIAESDSTNLLRPGRKVVLAQSLQFGPRMNCGEWRAHGVEAVIAVSQFVKKGVEEQSGMSATVIPPSIDPLAFAPRPKVRAIAFMPRRNLPDILEIFGRCHAKGFERREIHRQPLSRVGELLSTAAIFLAGSRREGFGLPALEALACGCLVAGFAGGGGRDFLEDGRNCLLAPDGDCEAAAHRLADAVRLVEEGRTGDLVREGLATAGLFSPAREAVELVRFWAELAEDGRNDRHDPPRTEAQEGK